MCRRSLNGDLYKLCVKSLWTPSLCFLVGLETWRVELSRHMSFVVGAQQVYLFKKDFIVWSTFPRGTWHQEVKEVMMGPQNFKGDNFGFTIRTATVQRYYSALLAL